MKCYLGIDVGTSNIKVLALDENGVIIAVQSKKHSTLTPYAGFAEQSPEIWWKAVCECINLLISNEYLKNYKIVSIGLSGQMHGLVALNRSGTPVRNAIVWLDRRSTEICNQWTASGYNEEFHNITGLAVATGYLAPSLKWVQIHEPNLYDNIYKIMLPKDYVRYKLTGKISTEKSDASGTYLFDVVNAEWSEKVLSTLGINPDILPKLDHSLEISDCITREASIATGLPIGIPVATGGSDQSMAALSLGINKPGIIAAGINTGGTVITAINRPIFDQRIHTFCHALDNQWLLMGATLSAGIALSWFFKNVISQCRQSVHPVQDITIEKLSKWADEIPSGSEGLIFSPFLSGERTPYMNSNAKGCFVGLTLTHSVKHMVRSILEGVAFSMSNSLDIFLELGLSADEIIGYAGGSNSATWRQIMSDVFNLPLKKLSNAENSSIGAAISGAMATGANTEGFKANNTVIYTHYPIHDNVQIYTEGKTIYNKIYNSLRNVFDDLSEFN